MHLASVINEFKPEIFLVGATAIGRDLGPTVSARVAYRSYSRLYIT